MLYRLNLKRETKDDPSPQSGQTAMDVQNEQRKTCKIRLRIQFKRQKWFKYSYSGLALLTCGHNHLRLINGENQSNSVKFNFCCTVRESWFRWWTPPPSHVGRPCTINLMPDVWFQNQQDWGQIGLWITKMAWNRAPVWSSCFLIPTLFETNFNFHN